MNSSFSMEYRESNRDLHVCLTGTFHHEAARALAEVLQRSDTGAGRIFLDVRNLAASGEGALGLLRQCLEDVPGERLLFKGELGFQLGKSGSRVLIVKKKTCTCDGKCAVCTCALRAKEAKERKLRQRQAQALTEERMPSCC